MLALLARLSPPAVPMGVVAGLWLGATIGVWGCLSRNKREHAAATGAATALVVFVAFVAVATAMGGIAHITALLPQGTAPVEHVAAGLELTWIGAPIVIAGAVAARAVVLGVVRARAARGAIATSPRQLAA